MEPLPGPAEPRTVRAGGPRGPVVPHSLSQGGAGGGGGRAGQGRDGGSEK